MTHIMRKSRLAAGLVAAALLAPACQDLDVTNPNEPDRERVLASGPDVEALIASQFRLWWPNQQNGYPNLALAAIADHITGGFLDYSVYNLSLEPRPAWDNSPLYQRNDVTEDPWYNLHGVVASVNTALSVMDEGLEVPNEPRARAFAKLMQGLARAYIALEFDQALIVDEHTDAASVDVTDYRPYQEVMAKAIAEIDEAIAIAEANEFTIPGDADWVNGFEMDNEEFIRLANSYVARFLAYTPRTPEERAQVDWTEVIRRVDGGLTRDFAPQGIADVIISDMRRLLARVRTGPPSDHIRPDIMVYGPADTSGQWQAWLAKPRATRTPFRVATPDRRIQGAASATAPGAYIGYNASNIWSTDRGTYLRSHYYYHRGGTGDSWYLGPQVTLTVDELRLLKAEALIRLNRAAEAVALINVTRVGNGMLPEVTIAGPPDANGCVPQKQDGTCGSLWDALRHEWDIEMLGIEGGVAFYNRRGWQALPENTPLHFPVPGRELETIGLPLYTFGGGGPGSAPPPNPEECPVTLPRCP